MTDLINRTISARDFNRDVSAAKRAADEAPVLITDRGEPAYVLMSIAAYRRLETPRVSLADALAMKEPVDPDLDLEFDRAVASIDWTRREIDLS